MNNNESLCRAGEDIRGKLFSNQISGDEDSSFAKFNLKGDSMIL